MDAGRLFGRGISFPPRIGSDGRVAWSVGEQNVREAIRVILLTQRRERVRLPEFGGDLDRYLFEPNTVTTRHLLREQVVKALTRWEPRIAVEEVQVETDPTDPESAIVTIHYQLIATQARERVSLNVSLSG